MAQEVDPATARVSSPAIKPSSAADEKNTAPPAFTRKETLVEREHETIIVREKVIPDQSSLKPLSVKSPDTPVSISSNPKEKGDSRPVVHSKIAPLIERVPEPVQSNRRTIQPQPTIHVTIGRVEVRAIQSAQAPAQSRPPTPVMNLDDYLKRRSQGNTR